MTIFDKILNRVLRKIAKNQGTELYIHGKDGLIRERDSYGNDPKRSKESKAQ